jgi:hypothetical protein
MEAGGRETGDGRKETGERIGLDRQGWSFWSNETLGAIWV